MPLNLFYTVVQKSQKWPKTQIKGGPALKLRVNPLREERKRVLLHSRTPFWYLTSSWLPVCKIYTTLRPLSRAPVYNLMLYATALCFLYFSIFRET